MILPFIVVITCLVKYAKYQIEYFIRTDNVELYSPCMNPAVTPG